MINLTIDGVQIEAKEGQSILSAAREHGIHIPTLCFLEKINEIGSCRICVVEVEGMNKLVTACNTKVKAGMQRLISHFQLRLSVLQRHCFLGLEVLQILICPRGQESRNVRAGMQGQDLQC